MRLPDVVYRVYLEFFYLIERYIVVIVVTVVIVVIVVIESMVKTVHRHAQPYLPYVYVTVIVRR